MTRWLLAILLVTTLVGCAPAAATTPSVGVEAEQIAARAVWAPGELEEHFRKHPEGYRSAEEYDRGARETIRRGVRFTYRDSQSDAPRLGFYDRETNRFTALTGDGRRITTHFRPDRGERYVRGLPGSTYR
jgi:pyocin large subunit-like protein